MREFIGKIFFVILVVVCIFYACIAFWVSNGIVKIENGSKIEQIKQTSRDSDIDNTFRKVH